MPRASAGALPDPWLRTTASAAPIAMSNDTRTEEAMAPVEPGRRFDEVVLPHLDAAYNLARWLTRDAAQADDLLQTACLRALRFFSGFRGGSARSWLFAIVRNAFYSGRRAGAEESELPLDEASAMAAVAVSDPELQLLRQADAQALRRALEALPAPALEVIVLREMEGLSYREIGEVVGVPIGTVMSRLARARGLLQRLLLADGVRRSGR